MLPRPRLQPLNGRAVQVCLPSFRPVALGANAGCKKVQFLEACHITEDKRGKSVTALCGL
jgi:hypothetical protein